MHLLPDMWGPRQVEEVHAIGDKPVPERLSARFFGWFSEQNLEKVGAIGVGTLLVACGIGVVADMAAGSRHEATARVLDTLYKPAYYTYSTSTDANGQQHRTETYHPPEYLAKVEMDALSSPVQVSLDRQTFSAATEAVRSGQLFAASYREGKWTHHPWFPSLDRPLTGEEMRQRLEARRGAEASWDAPPSDRPRVK